MSIDIHECPLSGSMFAWCHFTTPWLIVFLLDDVLRHTLVMCVFISFCINISIYKVVLDISVPGFLEDILRYIVYWSSLYYRLITIVYSVCVTYYIDLLLIFLLLLNSTLFRDNLSAKEEKKNQPRLTTVTLELSYMIRGIQKLDRRAALKCLTINHVFRTKTKQAK